MTLAILNCKVVDGMMCEVAILVFDVDSHSITDTYHATMSNPVELLKTLNDLTKWAKPYKNISLYCDYYSLHSNILADSYMKWNIPACFSRIDDCVFYNKTLILPEYDCLTIARNQAYQVMRGEWLYNMESPPKGYVPPLGCDNELNECMYYRGEGL